MASPDPTFASLSPAEKNLVRLMQSVGCGKLRNVPIHDGQPAFEAPMSVVRLIKFRPGQPDRPTTTQADTSDFPLRGEVLQLLRGIRSVKEGLVERLEVVNGLPTVADLAEPVTPFATTSTRRPAR